MLEVFDCDFMVQKLHKDPQGINKNNKEVKKDRPTQVSTDINKNNKEVKKDRHKGIRLTVRISDEEYQYYSLMLSIINGMTVNGKPVFGKFLSI